MSFIRETREARNDAAGLVAPVRGIKSGKCWHKIDATVITNGTSKQFDIGAFLNQSEIIAKPLDKSSGDGDAAFQSVNGFLIAEFVAEGSKKSASGIYGAFARVHKQEAAGAVSIFCFARTEAGLAKKRGLLIAQNASDSY